ncbi:Ig-like domain-containing protein [Kouleothrix sp.]|uniref:Ig-like domain-containing protein n=1 Tax=Kouleothrix sp. TaxID=2779161 RepID=UPI00391B462A
MERRRSLLRWRNINAVLLALVLLAAGLAFGPLALGGPRLISSTPADGARDANPQAGIQLVFSQWVRPESLRQAVRFDPPLDFTLDAPSLPRAGATTVTIKPAGGMRYGAAYRLVVGAGVSNLFGRTLDQPQQLAFATVPYLTVAKLTPAQGAAPVALNAPILVEFAAPVVLPETLAAAAQDPRVADTLPQPLALDPPAQGVGRWLTPTLFGFYPERLYAATSYSASVSAAVSSDGKFRLERPVSWSFTTAAPLLAGTRPFDGATDVPATGEIEVRLVPDVDAGSAGQSFSLRDIESGASIGGTVTPSLGGFRFKPAGLLTRGKRYQATLAPGITSSRGAKLNGQPLSWSFTVIGDLAVTQAEPLPATSEVLTDTNRVSVRFNHPVVAFTTLDDQAKLPQPLTFEPALSGEGRWLDTSTYVFTPKPGLAPSTSYTVRVAAGLQDQTGGALRQAYSWNFATVTPKVYGSAPQDGDQYAAPGGPFEVYFNQPLDPASLRGALKLLRDGAEVPGTISAGGLKPNVFTSYGNDGSSRSFAGVVAAFTPSAPLQRGASYTLVVAAGARAAQGNGTLASEYRVSFKVAELPRLVGSSPADGDGAAGLSGPLTLNFSAPMDWASVEQNLAIEPAPTELYTSTGIADYSAYFSLRPDSNYRVTLRGAARDAWGVPLGADQTIAFHTAPPTPALALVGASSRIGAYNAYVSARVPIQHVGTPLVGYTLYRLDPARVATLLTDYDQWNSFKPDPAALLRQADIALAGDRNTTRIDLLDLGKLDAGLYYLQVQAPGEAADRQIMAVSPYALTIKRSATQAFVWAVDMASGKPAANLPLVGASYDFNTRGMQPIELGATDAEGIVQRDRSFPDASSPFFVWSQAGGQFAFGTTFWGDGVNPWDFGLPADYGNSPVVGAVYTDRPIYRPEQNVYIRGAVRLDRHTLRYDALDAGQQAMLTIGDPEGNTIYSSTLALSEFGTFNTSLPIERSAKLGSYGISVLVYNGPPSDPASALGSFYGSFSVAEYRKPAFEVTVTPAQPDLVQGDTLTVRVAAKYFASGAVANAPLRWRLLANPYFFRPDDQASYSFEDIDDAYAWYRGDQPPQPGGELIADGQASTNAQGEFELKLPATLGKQTHSRALTLDVEITDVDGQVIAAQGTVNVHAGSFYVGLRPEGYVTQAGQPLNVSAITLDLAGQPAANRALTLKLNRREWNSVRQQGADGQMYWTSTFSDTLAETKTATTDAQGRASISFTPKAGGEYRVVAEARDDAGHAIASSAYSWVYGGDVFWGINDTARVDLIADKRSYRPGDTAGVLVTAPYKGMQALMTIERGAVIEHKLFTLSGATELLQVPLKAEYAPNVYVSVVLIKPAGGDVPVPDIRVGLVNLPISTEQQELKIDITPDKASAGPRDQVSYTIKATDYSGQGVRAEIGLALVDKAVLALADDPNPSFTQAFYTRRGLGVFTAPSLTALVDRVTLKIQPGDKGGGGGAGGEVLLRRNFPDTAYWNPTVVTAADGTAKVTLALPDSLTTWRMSARGISADTRVGQATTDIVATRPLLIRPTLPRFLTVGDKLTLQAVVQNTTASPIDATVTLDQAQDNGRVALRLSGEAQQRVQVPANGTALLRWPAEVPLPGQAVLRFSVAGAGLQDAIEQALPIARYTTPEVVASAGQVLDTTVETIAVPADAPKAPDGTTQGQVELELSPSLAAGVERSLDYLQHYPYDCSEQTVSRFLPNAVTYRLLGTLGESKLQSGLKANLEANLSAALQRLYALQHLDGGWGWWADDESRPYLSAYAVQGMIEARKAGYAVDQARLDQAIAFLKAALENPKLALDSQSATLNARSYMLFVLSEAGQPDRGRAVALYDTREQLAIYGRAYLLMTLKALGGNDDRVHTLVGELMSTAIMHAADAHWEEATSDYWNLGSDTRTTALALQALVRADPNNFLVPNAVRFLMAQRDAGHWRTTHESAVSLMALAEYIAQSGELAGDYSYRAALDGTTLKEGAVNRDNLADPIGVVVALADLKAGGQSQLSIQRQAASGQTGQGRLYYTLRMRYYQDASQVQALDRGVGLSREYVAVNTDTLSVTGHLVSGAKLGDVVQVRLKLSVPEDMQYFAIEDMLPAGLEAIDTSLKTSSAAAQGAGLRPADDATPYWWYFGQSSIRDDRVALFATYLPRGTYEYTYLARASTPGEFQTLPATAYQMYAPEVFGRSAGATFTVAAQ